MKKTKRMFSLFLAVLILLTAVPFTAFSRDTISNKVAGTVKNITVNGNYYSSSWSFATVDTDGTDYFNFVFCGFDSNQTRTINAGSELTLDIGMGSPNQSAWSSGKQNIYGFHFGSNSSDFGVSTKEYWYAEVTQAPSGATIPQQKSITGFGRDGVKSTGPVNTDDDKGSKVDYRNNKTWTNPIQTQIVMGAFNTPGTYKLRIHFGVQGWGWNNGWSEYLGTALPTNNYITFTVNVLPRFTFKNYAGVTVSTQYKSEYSACTKPGNTASTSRYEQIAGNNVNHNYCTYSYSWPTSVTADSTGNYVVNEVQSSSPRQVPHNFTTTEQAPTLQSVGKRTHNCNVCNYTYTENFGEKVDSTPLITAQGNAKLEAQKDIYTTSSSQTVQSNIDTIMSSVKPSATKTEVDQAIKDIEAERNKLKLKADFTDLDQAYSNADALLCSLEADGCDGYALTDIQLLAQLVNNANTYRNRDRNDTAKDDFQTNINTCTDALNTKLEELTSLDVSALNAAIENANHYDKDVFTNAAVADAKTQAERIFCTYNYNGKTLHCLKVYDSEDIDNTTKNLIEKLNNSRVEYKVTVGDNVELLSHEVNPDGSYSIPYGLEVVLQTKGGINQDVSWYASYDSNTTSRDEQYQYHGYQYRMKVLGNYHVTAKVKTDDTFKVQIVRDYGQANTSTALEKVEYVSGAYTLPAAKAIPNYTFDHYDVNGAAKNAGDVINVASNIQIKAVYRYSSSEFDVQINDSKGTQISTGKYAYNALVSLKTDESDIVAWVEKTNDNSFRLFYMSPECNFFVTETMTLQPATAADLQRMGIKTDVGYANLRRSGTMNTTDNGIEKVVFNGQFVLPEGGILVEKGILLAKNNGSGSINPEEVLLENAPGKGEAMAPGFSCTLLRCKSTKHTAANQFSIGVKNLVGTGEICYRAYLIYDLNGTIVTVYSDTVTETK